jgi:hypothetical protein
MFFETKVTLTKEIVAEYQQAFLRNGKFKKTAMIYFIVIGIFTIALFVLPMFGKYRFFLLLPPLLPGILMYQKITGLPKKEYQRYVEANGGEDLQVIYTIDENGILGNSVTMKEHDQISFSFDQMLKIIETSNLYVVFLKTNTVIPLAKEGFTAGISTECKKYILDKIASR